MTKWPTTKFGEDACPEIFGPGLGCPRSGKIAEKTQASIPSTVVYGHHGPYISKSALWVHMLTRKILHCRVL